MSERDIVKSVIDFSFIIKSQLQTERTNLLRSILSIAIMEAEDVLEDMDEAPSSQPKREAYSLPR